MTGNDLFGEVPNTADKTRTDNGAARLREPVRDQMELRVMDLEGLVGADHPVRVIWGYVEKLDLRVLEEAVRARAHTPGQAPVSPRLMVALWLFATSEGIGSARALARLCENHDAYRWLCGGVKVNYHGLADFRVAHGVLLEQLLTQSVASLSVAGVIDFVETAQDGIRVRASAGAASFRREKKLYKELKKAGRLIERLKRESFEDPGASSRRIKAADLRAAREREARIQTALDQIAAIEAHRARGGRAGRTNRKKGATPREPRASTTDPDARVMKMADGGFRPAYNCQVASTAGGQIVVAVEASNVGSDRALMRPMIETIDEHYDEKPQRHLVDGGFTNNDDIEWAAANDIKVYCPPVRSKHGRDPFAPRHDDGPGLAAWRARMKSPHGKAVYKRRARAECINARFRNWGLQRLTVRGIEKVTAVLHWFALANNILTGHRLLQTTA